MRCYTRAQSVHQTHTPRARAIPSIRAATGLVAIVVLSGAYLDYVFRLHTGVWRRYGLGDWIDPYLINAILEQWRYSVRHFASPVSAPLFFPQRGTLGYSHSLVLYAPFYVIARVALDPLVAHTVTILAVIEFGILSLYAILRRFVLMGVVESVLLVAVFATSRNVVNGLTGVWTQRASVFLVPPILLIGLASARRRRGPLRSLGLAAASFLAASLFTQDIYIGLLSTLVAVLLGAGAALLYGLPSTGIRMSIPPTRRPFGRARGAAIALLAFVAIVTLAWTWILRFDSLFRIPFPQRHHHWERPLFVGVTALVALELLRGGVRGRIAVTDRGTVLDLAAIAAGAVLGFAGFVWIYHIAYAQFHGFPAQQAFDALYDLDPGAWMQIVTAPRSWLPWDSGRSLAIVFVFALACCVPGLRLPSGVRPPALWLAAVALIVLMLTARIGHFALWSSLSAVPGFSAVRDPKRLICSFELAAVLWLGVVLARLPRASLPRRASVVIIAVAIALTWNPERFDYERPVEAFQRWVDAPITVDQACRSFFIKKASAAYMSRSPNQMSGLYGTDAEFIAMKYAVPTLNGFSAWEPPDWHMRDPLIPDYRSGTDDWIARHRLQGVCELDIDRRTMTPYQGEPGRP